MSTTYIYLMKITGKQCIKAQTSVAKGFMHTRRDFACLLSRASLSASVDINHTELSTPSHSKWKAIHHRVHPAVTYRANRGEVTRSGKTHQTYRSVYRCTSKPPVLRLLLHHINKCKLVLL